MLKALRMWCRCSARVTRLTTVAMRGKRMDVLRIRTLRNYPRNSAIVNMKPIILIAILIRRSYSFSSLVPRGQRKACTLTVVRRDRACIYFPRV